MAGTTTAPERATPVSPWHSAGPTARAWRRPLLIGVVAAFVLVSVWYGYPTGRDVITGWVLLLLLAACGGNVLVWARSVVRDWLPLTAVLFLYDRLRGSADSLGAKLADLPEVANGKPGPEGIDRAHVLPQLRADEVLFGWLTGGQVPTVWLQDQLYVRGTVHWYDVLLVPVYMSHFLVPIGLAVFLWIRRYDLYARYAWTLVTLTLLTLSTYALFPAAPPWMAGYNGYLPEVARVTGEVLRATGGTTVSSFVQQGEAYSNAVAAIPSLHSGFPAMVLLFTWPLVRPWVRALLVAYIAAMTFTLTYGGEHYVVDAFAGWAYAGFAVWVVARLLSGRRTQDGLPAGP